MNRATISPQQARALVDASERLVAHGRQASRVPFSGAPLVWWGIAWAVAYPALQWLPTPWAVVIAGLSFSAAALASWLPHTPAVRSGFETRIRLGWVAVMAASPFMVATVGPVSGTQLMLMLGALWGLVMMLTAIATSDPVLAVVTFSTVVMAGIAPTSPSPLASYGITAGATMTLFGLARVWRGRSPQLPTQEDR